MAEILERETEEYYKMDPDPFDDRHPAHTMPVCALGHLMRTLSKNDDFMNTVLVILSFDSWFCQFVEKEKFVYCIKF